jgi:formyltetrahydrofolate-dependent phosphoribosylglycinamide formyltransferase
MVSLTIDIAVLVSGSGTTLQNLIDEIAAGRLAARISIVIASRPNLGALDKAAAAGLPSVVVERRQFADAAAFSEAVFRHVGAADLVCMAGWLQLLPIPPAFENRVINIHPALLPQFGGRGMYGKHVHEAVLKAGCKISGCTVHFVDNEYDHGPIILQRRCDVLADDTAKTLAARVFEEEKIAYPQAIAMFAARRNQ